MIVVVPVDKSTGQFTSLGNCINAILVFTKDYENDIIDISLLL